MDITRDFTDERFKQWVLAHFCDDRGTIQSSDIDTVTSLSLTNQKLSSLAGLEHFRMLEELDCSNNQLTVLEISRNPYLKSLIGKENQLLSLDLSANLELEILDCSFNRLRALDVSNNRKLVKLECHWNMLSRLNLDHNPSLKELSCSYNAFFTLELHHNKLLERLECSNNYISHLDVSSCMNLLEIRCNHNHLTELDTCNNPKLESVRCFNNHISKLDFSQNKQLQELYCSENKLTELNSELHSRLDRIQFGNNLIIEPDISVSGVGIFQYDVSMSYYTATLTYKGQDLVVTTDASTKVAMDQLSPVIEEAWEQFDELCERTLQVIGNAHPDEDVNGLILADVVFQEGGCLRVGYDAGDTPAGRLYLYAAFNGKLEISDELIYETY
ncbi:leucine-rich repeat domain-containing protein [Paenibacillus pabuli]|uniref:leucine-rich repeat domain-containing protein n=1 Tax=Paenibacillus pabuli TaxID=1472 RepID=UPI001FFF22A6|nr:leucine-rich repeat domain-containing protein [Paenibacillus pabuli]UPK46597.1 leucine-rich repeat domain-containing protein [Paenibacillus pabuli]